MVGVDLNTPLPTGLQIPIVKRFEEAEKLLGLDFVGLVTKYDGDTVLSLHKNLEEAIVYTHDGELMLQMVEVDLDEWPYNIYPEDFDGGGTRYRRVRGS